MLWSHRITSVHYLANVGTYSRPSFCVCVPYVGAVIDSVTTNKTAFTITGKGRGGAGDRSNGFQDEEYQQEQQRHQDQ